MYRRFVFETVAWYTPPVNGIPNYNLYLRTARKSPICW
jgi:hypothetical protein